LGESGVAKDELVERNDIFQMKLMMEWQSWYKIVLELEENVREQELKNWWWKWL
jgi:hypothetical protein